MFVDQVEIGVQAGTGGDGCCSFRREKFVPRGGPDGGDGGHGGDVIFVADSNLSTLADLRYKKWGQAEDGHPGRGKQMTGRSGEDWRIKVPVGTLVKDAETGDLLVDLKEPFQEFVAVRGGRGGQGNARFKSSTNRAPRQFQKGEPGEQRHLVLELKLLADVGIIGFPNAGKSTLISKISHARPKIGDYPFTTLIPQLGVVEMEDFFSFVAADIPGLIEGAHRGKGLGIQFLKHTERTRLLLHLLDFSSDRDPLNDYHTLQKELECFSRDLYDKPQILVPTKMDDPRARERFSELESRLKRLNPDVVPISSVTGDGVQELLWDIKKRLQELRGPAKGSAGKSS